MSPKYKLGKTPARKDAVKLKLSLFGAKLATPPAKYEHYDLEAADWGMLGNDQYGDCVWAGSGHEYMLWNKEADKTVMFTTDNVLAAYTAVTGFNPKDPDTDQGTDMELAAKYRRKTGVVDSTGTHHKVGAYLAIEAQNRTELKQAVSTFSAVGIGIQVPESAQTQFSEGKPWTVVKNSPIEGGHYVPVVGYDSKYVYVVTWGQVQKMAWAFFDKYNDEGIAYLSNEMLTNGKSIDGFDLASLTNILKEL